jgi:hypothetical protein
MSAPFVEVAVEGVKVLRVGREVPRVGGPLSGMPDNLRRTVVSMRTGRRLPATAGFARLWAYLAA